MRPPIVRSYPDERALDRALPAGNLLLRKLAAWDGADVLPVTREKKYGSGEVVLSANALTSDRLVFPLTATLSEFVRMQDGAAVETGTIGRESAAGIEAILDAARPRVEVIAALPGTVVEMQVADVHAVIERVPGFQSLLLRAAAFHLGAVRSAGACNRLHDTRSRLARWFLGVDDRLTTPSFFITHELLAEILGVRRPSITLAARDLQHDGAIGYSRGSVRINSRALLRNWSCECYLEMRRQMDAFVGESAP